MEDAKNGMDQVTSTLSSLCQGLANAKDDSVA